MSTVLKTLRTRMSKNERKVGGSQQGKNNKKTDMPSVFPRPVPTNYTSKEVSVPDTFLTTFPSDSKPVTVHPIDFSKTVLPEYAGCYAVVLENVLSPSECRELISLAEQSVIEPVELDGNGSDAWKPAMVNAGPGYEILAPDYRNSDRIIWDHPVVMDRLLQRCFLGEGIEEQLSKIEGNADMQGWRGVERGDVWRLAKLNERMRFLRYGPGQFFKAHCDGAYQDPATEERSFYTLHLYLNDSKQTVPDQEDIDLVGGATTFHLKRDTKWDELESRKIDVDPKTGRVLIFQHKKLLHAGADVTAGIKYTMRTDLMYKLVNKEEKAE